jgi:hypothetical protein
MRHIQNPIATALDDFELVMKTFDKSTRVTINEVIRHVIKPFLQCRQKAVKAAQRTFPDLFHPFLESALSLPLAHRGVKQFR